MLRVFRQRPLLANATEVMTAAVRYVAIMIVFIVLLGQLANVAL